jgi:hypothetical protein
MKINELDTNRDLKDFYHNCLELAMWNDMNFANIILRFKQIVNSSFSQEEPNQNNEIESAPTP